MPLHTLNDPDAGFVHDDDTLRIRLDMRLIAPAVNVLPAGYPTELLLVTPVAEVSLCGICLCVMRDPVCCADGHKCVLLSACGVCVLSADCGRRCAAFAAPA